MLNVGSSSASILERSYRTIVDAVREGICLVGPDRRIQFVNKWMAEMVGEQPETMIGREFHEYVSEADQPFALSLMAGRMEVENEHYDVRMRGQRGEIYAMISASRLLDEAGRLSGSLKLITDITERKEYEEELGRYAAELTSAQMRAEAATQAKSAFLANMSHEIRTPMNAIIGMASLLRSTDLTARQMEFVETIRQSSEHLLSLISDILDFSKIEAGRMALETVRFPFHECLENCLDLVATQANSKGLDLALSIEPRVPRELLGDLTRVRQVVVNLLSNAVKFTRKGHVMLRASLLSREGSQVRVRVDVKDTGIGIAPDKVERLFRAFSQVDSSTVREFGGTGLGLAISQKLAAMMEGRIEVQSQQGTGSMFSFEFAATLASAAPDLSTGRETEPILSGRRVRLLSERPASRIVVRRLLEQWGAQVLDRGTAGYRQEICVADAESHGQLLAARRAGCPTVVLHGMGQVPDFEDLEKRFGLLHESLWLVPLPLKASRLKEAALGLLNGRGFVRTEEPEVKPAKLKPRPGLRILIAEDNPVNQKVLLLLLEDLGYAADLANDGQEALEKGRQGRYDVIFMDVQMPRMDGFQATRKLRAEGVNSLIVALTANALSGDRQRCLDAGMHEYLAKPVRAEDLAEVLQHAPGEEVVAEKAALPDEDIEWAIFEQLLSSKSAARHVPQLLDMVETDSGRRLENLRSQINAGQWPEARAEAHTLKGSVGYLGLARLAGLCREMEARAEAKDGAAICRLATDFQRGLPAALSALRLRA